MDPQVQAVARAICAAEGLDPDATISDTAYAGGVRADHRHDMPQWETKALEAAKFIMMHRALASMPGPAETVAGTPAFVVSGPPL